MKPVNSLRLALAAGLALGLTPLAQATGVDAGQSISNTASVDYEVGGVNQPDVDSNTTTFVVDRKITVTVTNINGGATNVAPGSSDQMIVFRVQNTSNSTLDFALSAANLAGDDYQVSNFEIYVESGANAGFDPTEDTATFIDELAEDAMITVYVLADVPGSLTNGQDANITLTATAHQDTSGTGAYVATAGTLGAIAVETNTATADDPNFIDTVFGDAAGTAAGDTQYDGEHSATGQYNVATATISVTKSSLVVTDPFNCTVAGDNSSCTTPPKAIPGAIVEYCLDVNNASATTAADAIVLTDSIPTNTTFVTGSIRSAATGTGAACDLGSGTTEDNNATDADETDGAGGNFGVTTAGAVTVTTPTIGASSRFKATFRVTVD
jgi:uncharacterized repeat protein (TIGR01451 family)